MNSIFQLMNIFEGAKNKLKMWDQQEQNLLDGEKFVCEKSLEYASRIIVSIVDGKEDTVNGNVLNNKFISNLPDDCCVEVPCKINNEGINPQKNWGFTYAFSKPNEN